MSKSDESANISDPSQAPFENYLRRFQPRAARVNLEEIVQPKGPTQYLHALSDVTDSNSPIFVSQPTGTHFSSASTVATTWPRIGAAWAGGMVMGCLLMFVVMSRFQNVGGNSALAIGDTMQASLDQKELDQKELVRTSRDHNVGPISAAGSTMNEDSRRAGDNNAQPNRSQRINSSAPLSISDEFAILDFDLDKSNRSPRSLVSYYRQLSGLNSQNWSGTAEDQSRGERGSSRPGSFSPASPRKESEEKSEEKFEKEFEKEFEDKPIYQLHINLPSTSEILNQHQLTQELMKDFSL